MKPLLDEIEARVVGSLIEKELTTPDYYPLTVNSLMNACNQKSNRDPVVNYDDEMVQHALDRLREKQYARRITGSDMRVPKYRQTFTEELKLSPQETAVLTILMLRGPQTPGEIKGRTGRMFNFESLHHVEDLLTILSSPERNLIVKLQRQGGMKESRYMHLFCGDVDLTASGTLEKEHVEVDRLLKAEEEINVLKEALNELKDEFEKFRAELE